ncbi:MAG: hypothetical protein WC156_06835 [Pedobacter sp.]
MAFSLDRTRSFIKIDEPDLISIHRSNSPIVLTDYNHGHFFDAFICAAHENNLLRVYIGLHDSQLKSNLVFVADPVAFDNKNTAILIKEAETFLTNIGFSMELINMEFSPAIREVIMRDLKVMREPSLSIRFDAAMFAIEELTVEKNELIQKMFRAHKAFKAEVDKLRQQLVLANSAALEATDKSVSDEESVAALMVERDSLRAELAVIREEIEAVRSEHDTIMAVQYNEIHTLQAALAIADESLSLERTKNESALQKMDALEKNAAVDLKMLKKRIDSLSDEKHMLESMAAEMNFKAKREIERLQQINQSQRSAAIKKVKTLIEEMRQLSEARAVMTSPPGVSLSTADVKKSSESESEMEILHHVTDSASSGEAFSNPFGFSDKSENISFEPDSTLNGIPYSRLEDVVEVHRSFNKIQAAPIGKQVQSCDGFVCLVKVGQYMLVYVVWFMNETGEVLVCRPDHIPESLDIALNMVRDGIGYFERVGFIMDKLILKPESEQRQNQIDSLSFFQKISI